MYNTTEFKELMERFQINVGKIINDLLLKNLPQDELEKEMQKVKERVERIKEEQQKFIKKIQDNCAHKHKRETVYNKIRHIFCKDCLKQLKIEKIS